MPETFSVSNGLEMLAPPPGIGAGALIETADGEVAVDWLSVGDMIKTRDHGFQPLLWIGHMTPGLLPAPCIHMLAHALGYGCPNFPTTLTANQHVELRGAEVELHFGEAEVLATAQQTADWRGVDPIDGTEAPPVYALLFEEPQLVSANGIWLASMTTAEIDEASLSQRSAATLDNVRDLVMHDCVSPRQCLKDEEIAVLSPPERRRAVRAA